MTASVNHKCWICSLHTRNDIQRSWEIKGGRGRGARLQRAVAAQPVTYNKTSAGCNRVYSEADGFETNMNTNTVRSSNAWQASTSRDGLTFAVNINYVQCKQTALTQPDRSGSNACYSYMRTAPQHTIYTPMQLWHFFFSGRGDVAEKISWLEAILFTSATQDGAFSC